ncbi:MAG: VOC family protein [Alphaproteobacteria bacterium]|nr:VOC family protein [Alphaproteobacteria bacterium]
MIRGLHAMYYTDHAEELRAFFRDILGFPHIDAGGGWLIFQMPEADLGMHPTEGAPPSGTADLSFYCDDIAGTVATLTERGVTFTGPVEDHGYGLVTHFLAPGDLRIQLYEPKYGK